MEERLEGWLQKRGDGLFKRWHPRWTVLYGDSVSFFKGPGGSEPAIRVLKLEEIKSVEQIGSEEFGRAFRINCKSSQLVLRADTTDDMHRWSTSIVTALHQHCPSSQLSPLSRYLDLPRRGSDASGYSQSRRGSCCPSELSIGDSDDGERFEGFDPSTPHAHGSSQSWATKEEIFDAGVRALKDILTAESEVDVDLTRLTASTTLQQDKTKYVTVFAVFPDDDDEHIFGFIAAFLYKCPSKKRDLMSEFILQANYGLMFGYLDLDLDDGQLSFKTYVDYKGYSLTEACKLIKPALCDALRTARTFFPAAQQLMFQGKTLGEATAIVTKELGHGNLCEGIDRKGDLKKLIEQMRAEMPPRTPRTPRGSRVSLSSHGTPNSGSRTPRRLSVFAA
mmetsp:Transcript_40068/g.65000  ORF Transcript_40068/g.65000 Transcript_40068/m.65000 type:complete len:392 (+) Transcript_40068:82-1257(+)|eukprot:CAMPEP_0184652706 /NCGR_PEP_ID=MMETSP0308-20130426/10406_1 /TAXON_ID=38269 /ORGANISM="Gloeochaete witrockiana, Strain SAG 46.84" /LENGTH=391 /DNA_ID=CAMNT_0027087735 /DNA_START=63 /DNA_END=1238 /DNA_ORIENTATION=-